MPSRFARRYIVSWVVGVGFPPGSVLAQDAAMFRGGAAHEGVYRTSGVPQLGGLQWRVQTGGPVRSSPAVANGVVYVGSGDGVVYAIDARSGDVRWRHDLGSAVTSSPSIVNDVVYIGGRDGTFRALRAGDGGEVWTVRTGPEVPLAWGHESGQIYTSSPTVVDGLALFGAGDGHLYAVDAATGRERWKYRTGGRVYSSPAIAGGVAFVGSQDGVVHAVDLASGGQKWRHQTEGVRFRSEQFGFDRTTIQSSPAVVGGTVYVGARDGFLYALDRETGARRWKFDHEVSWVNSSPAVSDGVVYAGTSDGHFVQAVDAESGKERWRTSTVGTVWASPAVDSERLYVGEGNGTMYALDRRTGKEAWRYRVGHRLFSSPVVHEGRLYFGSDDGGVYAVNAARGEPLRRAVYWDSAHVGAALIRNHAAVRSWLADRGYEVLDAPALARFMTERLRDRAPSVVVFAIDDVPSPIAATASDTVLFRRYLEGGGRVVWVGTPPLLWPRPATGNRSLRGVTRDATAKLLGVRHTRGNFDLLGVSRLTRDGARLALPAWWMDNWGAEPEDVTTVLAYDEQGQAAAWVKRYARGGEFVRLYAGDGTPGRPWSLVAVQTAAEVWPRE